MIVSIHQPNFFPYYGYFDKINVSDIFVFLDNVTYSKESFTNRNRIKTPKGEAWLTVPLNKKGILEKEIKNVTISNTIDWRTAHMNLIHENYVHSKYYRQYENIINSIYKKEWHNLSDLNIFITETLAQLFNIGGTFIRASELDVHGKKETLIPEICKAVGADVYYCGISGRKYNDNLHFEKYDIKIIYQNIKHPIYQQLYGDFLSNLSIIDLIFNMGVDLY
jgi:hypothetical protein